MLSKNKSSTDAIKAVETGVFNFTDEDSFESNDIHQMDMAGAVGGGKPSSTIGEHVNKLLIYKII